MKIKVFQTLLFICTIIYYNNSFSQDLSPEKIYETVNNSVVVILAYDEDNQPISQGSGVVIDNDGHIVTNYHVISGSDYLVVQHYDNIISEVEIVKIDVLKDLLILKISENIFPKISMGDVSKLKPGQKVFAIGSPFGLENSITEGIISGLRYFDDLGRELIQISASISPGSSGGAIVNNKGELIGISTLSLKDGQNLNFAISISEIDKIKSTKIDEKQLLLSRLLYKANKYLVNNQPEYALKYYNEFIETKIKGEIYTISYDFIPVYINMGIAYGKLKEYDKAINYFRKSLDLDKNNPNAYYNKGLAYFYKADDIVSTNDIMGLAWYKAAISDFTKAINYNSNFINAYYNRALAYSAIGKYDEAKNDLYKIIAIDKSYESKIMPLIEKFK